MLKKVVKGCALAGFLGTLLSGLCASAQTNTTAPSTPAPATVLPKGAVPVIRMALLLPLDSPTLTAAAEAVRDGFFTAFDRDSGNVSITTFKIGAPQQDVLTTYLEAAAQNDIVIGPLTRDEVAAIAQSGKINIPTVALAQPDGSGEGEVIFPQKMLMMGLSAEDEARQAATLSSAGKKTGLAFIVSTSTAWQRRAAKAFAEEWQQHGLTQQSVELVLYSGFFDPNSAVQLKERIQSAKPAVVFVALDAAQTVQLRSIIGNEAPLFGTSQLNALTLGERRKSAPAPELNNVRLIDIPWQLQADHLAVMSYPPLPLNPNQKNNADLARLYALGIDAYRVAKEIASQQSDFTIDGVTGALSIRFGKGAPSFKRVEQPAIYQQGRLVPLNPAP